MKRATLVLTILLLPSAAIFLFKHTMPRPASAAVLEMSSPAGPGSALPNLNVSPQGTLRMSWVEPAPQGHVLRFSKLEKDGWTPPREIARGESWFVNWADFPSLLAVSEDFLAAHWLAKSGERSYDYDVRLSLSRDGGATWSESFVPHRDGVQAEHGFVSLRPWKGGLAVVWLDGRDSGGEHGPMSLRFTTVDADGRLGPETLLDGKVCDCCQTAAAAVPDGLLVAYRDRSDQEIRDISTVRLSQGQWSGPARVAADGWEIAGCPVNGPALAAAGRTAAVAWHSEAADEPKVQVAFSSDSGASFGNPVRADLGNPLGRVSVGLDGAGAAVVSWLEEVGDGQTHLLVRRVAADGRVGEPLKIAELVSSRAAGFPRMALLERDAVFAWTDVAGSSRRVRTALARLSEIPQLAPGL